MCHVCNPIIFFVCENNLLESYKISYYKDPHKLRYTTKIIIKQQQQYQYQ